MPWQTIRPATPDDEARLAACALAFIQQNALSDVKTDGLVVLNLVSHLDFLADKIKTPFGRHLRRHWHAVVKRTLGEPRATGTVNGYIGYYV